ncbi:MAG: hypothetical protein NZ744_02750 [Pirellulaceae bacterium]|nr:hypothetical protein [Pirellulaceae bacterium]
MRSRFEHLVMNQNMLENLTDIRGGCTSGAGSAQLAHLAKNLGSRHPRRKPSARTRHK